MYIDTKDLPAQLRALAGSFKAVQVDARNQVTKHADDGTWSGGTRRILGAVELEIGCAVFIIDTFSAPWSADRASRVIALKPGFGILTTGHFCGKPSMPHLYVHPDDLAPLLPAPEDNPMSPDENVWLYCVCSLKSAYRAQEAQSHGLSVARINIARQALFNRGYLSAVGAATTKGKNARPERLPSRWDVTPAADPLQIP